jgi:class 3 adenylate cyclase
LLMPLFTGERRVETLASNQPLCSMDEDADCIWIVEEGLLQVMAGVSAVWRQAGDIIGEMAFLRNFAGVSATRGNDVVAACRTKVWRIDRSTLDGLSYEARAVWYETIARALVAKLDQASQLRAGHARDLATGDQIIRRLVCPEGVQAASATLLNGAEHIPPVKKTAVIWFSDLSGFSAHSEDLDAIKVGEDLRRLTDPQVEEITAARGQVDKHMGDAVMAFWLCPDPTRLRRSLADATRAALRAAQRVSEIAEASKIPIGIRIGLHVGEVSVGDFGGGDRIAFTIVGQPVNEAARYEQHRLEPGQPGGRVRVSDKVFTALPDELRSSFQPAALEFFDKHDRRFVAFLSSI